MSLHKLTQHLSVGMPNLHFLLLLEAIGDNAVVKVFMLGVILLETEWFIANVC